MMKFVTPALIISASMFALCTFTNAFTANNLMSTPTQNLRGNTPQDIIITGDVELHHLLRNKVHSDHLRRLGPIPASKAINVPCHNTTSNCGIHGVCRISGEHKFCHCDTGYSSFTKDNPCAEKGESQLVLAIMQYIFGYTGGPAFALGWTALGISALMMCCCGCCCTTAAKEENMSDSKRVGAAIIGILCTLAAVGLWIYTAVKISTDCVDKYGTPCKDW